jgi:hypothetical protein
MSIIVFRSAGGRVVRGGECRIRETEYREKVTTENTEITE